MKTFEEILKESDRTLYFKDGNPGEYRSNNRALEIGDNVMTKRGPGYIVQGYSKSLGGYVVKLENAGVICLPKESIKRIKEARDTWAGAARYNGPDTSKVKGMPKYVRKGFYVLERVGKDYEVFDHVTTRDWNAWRNKHISDGKVVFFDNLDDNSVKQKVVNSINRYESENQKNLKEWCEQCCRADDMCKCGPCDNCGIDTDGSLEDQQGNVLCQDCYDEKFPFGICTCGEIASRQDESGEGWCDECYYFYHDDFAEGRDENF